MRGGMSGWSGATSARARADLGAIRAALAHPRGVSAHCRAQVEVAAAQVGMEAPAPASTLVTRPRAVRFEGVCRSRGKLSMVRVICERTFEVPLADAELGTAVETLTPCLKTHGVRWARSVLSVDRRRMICEYEAPDAEAVRASRRDAGVEFDGAWSAAVLSP